MTWTKGLSLIETACRFLLATSFLVLMAAVMVQVLGRTVFDASPVWTEELARFALLYLAALGLGLSYRSGDLVNVDLVCEALPGRYPWILRLVSALLTAGLCAILIGPAWRYTSIGAMQTSPALAWRMDFIHASVLVLLISLLLFSLARIVGMLTGQTDGLPRTIQDDIP